MSIESIKHKKDKRSFIPSKEEAGTEAANPKVKKKEIAEYPNNPIVHRGQDPELFWMNKYGADDTEDKFSVDIRSLYRTEHISPETLIKNFYNISKNGIDEKQFDMFQMFGNDFVKDEIEKVSEYYKHQNDWSNRMILGDSLLVMNSLLEREGMSGKVQMIYFDPPYGIKYGSNWQMKLNNRNVKDGSDDALSGEPEQIKAYRDTWELGIHSYLSYMRDRLLVAKDMLTESGSCFVQISDENVHLVRNIMDEVFGSENFVSLISFTTTSGFESTTLSRAGDYIIWYAKDKEHIKFRPLYYDKSNETSGYNKLELVDGSRRNLFKEEKENYDLIPKDAKLYSSGALFSAGTSEEGSKPFEYSGKLFYPGNGHWKTNHKGLKKLVDLNRIEISGNTLRYVRYFDDFPLILLNNLWKDTQTFIDKLFVVQTSPKPIHRCMLMTTDPGDLVFDPTCGSGTTAFVAEQWGRRWITTDTSRIALNIAKTRLMTAVYPYYKLHDEADKDIRQGFEYKKVPHITLKSCIFPEDLNNNLLKDIYGTGISVLSIIFTVFFAALSIIISTSEDSFVKYLIENKFYERIISSYKITLGSLFIALLYTIVLYVATIYWLSIQCILQSNCMFIIFTFIFYYSLIASFLSVITSLEYMKFKSKFLDIEDTYNEERKRKNRSES